MSASALALLLSLPAVAQTIPFPIASGPQNAWTVSMWQQAWASKQDLISDNFSATFPTDGMAIGVKNGGLMVPLNADGSGNLNVNCVIGCAAGTASNAADAVVTSVTNAQTVAWNYGFNGATWDRLRVDASKNLNVNCQTGCGTQTVSNASSGVATSATNGQALAWLMGFNGTTWDQIQVDASKFLKVAISASTATLTVGNTQGSTTSGQSGPLVQGAVTTAAPTYTTAQTSPLSLDTGGALRVNLTTAGVSNLSTNIAQMNGVATTMGNGVSGTGVQRVTIASDSTGTIAATQSGTWTVAPGTSGGLSVVSNIVAANTTSVAIKASAGQLYGIEAYSISASTPAYIKIYNAVQGSTTCGSGTPVGRYMIPASGGAAGSGQIWNSDLGIAYGTAMTYCVTAGIADADTTSPAASTYLINVRFK